jgi:hypothetical protein
MKATDLFPQIMVPCRGLTWIHFYKMDLRGSPLGRLSLLSVWQVVPCLSFNLHKHCDKHASKAEVWRRAGASRLQSSRAGLRPSYRWNFSAFGHPVEWCYLNITYCQNISDIKAVSGLIWRKMLFLVPFCPNNPNSPWVTGVVC